MLRFLSPIWLAGLAALAVPLLLHLWNRRPTAVVRIGSLRGLAGPPGPRALGRRLEDVPLLLLRMSVLAAVVVGLAGLALRPREFGAGAVRALLVDPALLEDSLAVFSDPVVDSARRAGDPIHLLAVGFPQLGEAVPAADPAGVWALLRQFDEGLPTGSRVTVLTLLTAGRLGPARPDLRSRFEFRRLGETAARRDEAWAGVARRPETLADRPVDTTAIELYVGQGFEHEGELVAAAWSAAIEAHAGVPPRVLFREPNDAGIQPVANTIVWLADQSVPTPLLDWAADGASLIEISRGQPQPVADPGITVIATSGAAAGLFRESVWLRSGVPAGTPVLADGSGSPLLTVTSHGAGQHYRLATRFNDDWSTLGLGSDLPELALMTLRGPVTGIEAAPVSPSQAATRLREAGTTGPAAWRALTPWGILLAALLLVAERLVSHQRPRVHAA